MGGRTITMAPSSSPRQVAFNETLQLCRPARDDEFYVMDKFAAHAAHCPRCADPYRTHLANDTLCDRGHAHARDVAQYVYNKAGLPFSVTDRRSSGDRVQIEVPSGCDAIRGLLKAIDRGLRVRAKGEARSAAISQDRTYDVRPRSPPRRDRERRTVTEQADIYEMRPSTGSRRDRERETPRAETRYVEGRGSGYRRDMQERQQSGRNDDPVIIVTEPRGSRRISTYNR